MYHDRTSGRQSRTVLYTSSTMSRYPESSLQMRATMAPSGHFGKKVKGRPLVLQNSAMSGLKLTTRKTVCVIHSSGSRDRAKAG